MVMSKYEAVSKDMGLLGTLANKLSEEIKSLMAKPIPQHEKDVLERYLPLLHNGLTVIGALNKGLRPKNMDIDKFTFSYAEALKNVSEVVRSHPSFTPLP